MGKKYDVASKKAYDRVRYLRRKAERIKNQPPDPITLLSDLELAYIAGLVDGEASIHITSRGRRRTVYPHVAIGMTHKGVIEWLASKLGQRAIYTVRRKRGNFKKTPKPMYYYRVSGKRARLLCEVLIPYLKVKIEHAKVLAEYPCDARIAPGVTIEQTEINAVRERLRKKLTNLNGNYYAYRHPRTTQEQRRVQ